MQAICSNDTRIMNYEFKNQGDFRDTYSALWYVRTLVLDPGRLSEHPGSDWDNFWLLKTPLVMISNSSFLPLFQTFVLPLLAASHHYFRAFALLM